MTLSRIQRFSGTLEQTRMPMTQDQGCSDGRVPGAPIVLVGMAGLLLETESEALFSLKSRKPDPKSQTSIRKA